MPEGVRFIFGKEMRGGLEGGHQHISFSSVPVLKGTGVRADCPACVEWAGELATKEARRQRVVVVSYIILSLLVIGAFWIMMTGGPNLR